MDINVTVSDVTLDTVLHAYGESERTIGDEVTRQLVRRIADNKESYDNLRSRVAGVRDEEIRAHIVPLIEEALTSPVQEYRYGEPAGKPTTLRSMIMDEARALMKRHTDNYSNRSETVIGKLVADEVRKAIGGEIAEQVKEARAKVAPEIGRYVAEMVTQKLGK